MCGEKKKMKYVKKRPRGERATSRPSFTCLLLAVVCNVWCCQCFGSAASRVTHSAADRVNNYS